ncbi:MAG: SDR family NAD(P)-dependent oxidoreductase [Gemmatimonadota bacterium]|nr:SDR family NAD(P)-dependent oxidoreductase [Gemmatimonadota bacterium]
MGYNLRRYGSWCLVTGASSGIGLEFARAAAADGMNLVLVARRRERLESLASELEKGNGIETLVIELDLSSLESVDLLSEKTAHIEVDILILNAGYGYYGDFIRQDEDDLARMITLNCTSTALLARRFLPKMADRGRGALIIVSSVLGFFPGPWGSAYSATKAFDLMLGESLAPELRDAGVDLLNCCPASTRTEFHGVANKYRGGDTDALTPRQAEPAVVVRQAFKALGRKTTVFPMDGVAASVITRVLPRSWTVWLAGRVMGGKIKNK